MTRPLMKTNSLKSLFTHRSLQGWTPVWTYKSHDPLWLMKFSGDGYILLETRNTDERRVRFSCIEESGGKALWKDQSYAHEWWAGIEDVCDGRVFFHGYRKPDMPMHLGITTVDLQTGQTLWHENDATFLFTWESEVYISRRHFGGEIYATLDVETGTLLRDFGSDNSVLKPLRLRLNEQDRFAGYLYPEHFDEQHPLYEEYHALVFSYCDLEKARGNIDVLLSGNALLLSWHEVIGFDNALQQRLAQRFFAFDARERSLVYRDTISDDRPQPGIDSYFIKDRQLLYIRNGLELVAHSLDDISL